MDTATHEHLLQVLSSLLVQLQMLQVVVEPTSSEQQSSQRETVREGLQDVVDLAREALSAVRTSLEALPLEELENTTFSEALVHLVEATAERLGLASRISLSGVDEAGYDQQLSAAIKRLVFLTLREALYEVERHAEARRIRFSLHVNAEEMQAILEDDGINLSFGQGSETENEGQNVSATPPFESLKPLYADRSFMQTPMIKDLQLRLQQWGGSFVTTALEKRGTRVHIALPLVSAQQNTPAIHNADVREETPTTTTDVVHVLIVDNQAVTRAGLRRLLESYAGIEVVGEAVDGVQAVSETLELGPRVVLMDTQLPGGQSMEALHQIKQLNLDTKVLLLATEERESYLYEALRSGADGYVLKDISPDELARAIHTVARGEVLVQPELAGKLLSRFGRQGNTLKPYEALTARELEVLRLLARGLRNKEIASRLYVSERTVNFHLANIYQKLGVSGRTEALSRALEQGLITP